MLVKANEFLESLSPSMRREWIEIRLDRGITTLVYCLPPCGGSGLKYHDMGLGKTFTGVSLHAEGVD